MKDGPFKIEKKGTGFVIDSPGMIITAKGDRKCELGIDAIAAQLNRAHEAGQSAGVAEERAKDEKLSATYGSQRNGWRVIAEALLSIGMGYQMRGFGDTPPTEILASLGFDTDELKVTAAEIVNGAVVRDAKDADQQTLAGIRDALFGRAWRVRGSDGSGQCDYPLCATRAAKQPFTLVDVSLISGVKLHVCAANVIGVGRATDDPDADDVPIERHECHRWALWVQERVLLGRIAVAK